MAENNIYKKWIKKVWNKEFWNKFHSFFSTLSESQINSYFNEKIKIDKSNIILELGIGTHLANEFTITAISEAFSKFISVNNKTNKNKILVSCPDSDDLLVISNIFSRVLYKNKNDILFYEQKENTPLNLISYFAQENNFDYIIDITNYNNSKKFIQIRLTDSKGVSFCENDINKLNKYLQDIDLTDIEVPISPIEFIDLNIENNNYIDIFSKQRFNNETTSKLKYNISFQEPKNIEFYKEVFKKANANLKLLTNTKIGKNLTISDNGSFRKMNVISIFKRNDINFIISGFGDSFNISVKHKGTFKYFKPDEIAGLYLDYLLNNFNINEKYYIAKSKLTGEFIKSIASLKNIDVLEFNNWDELNQIINASPNKKLLFAYDEFNRFIPFDSNYIYNDGIIMILDFYKMCELYRSQSMTLYDKLIEIKNKYSNFYQFSKTYDMTFEQSIRFFKRINDKDKVGEFAIVKKQIYNFDFEKNKTFCELKLTGRINIKIIYDKFTKKITIHVETQGKTSNEKNSEDYLKLIVQAKEILDTINEFREDFVIKKFSLRGFLKYGFLVSLTIAIFIFLFYVVYNIKLENNTSASALFVLRTIWMFIRYDKMTRFLFVFIFIFILFEMFINALIFKRLFMFQNEKVSFWNLFVGSFIGIIIQNITPKSIGSDIATYWYLRRKGLNRSKLISSVILNTFIWQLTNILLSIIVVPVGLVFYKELFSNGSSNNVFSFTFFLVISLLFDTLFSIFFLTLAGWKRIQTPILKAIIRVLEWFGFIGIIKSDEIYANWKYELYKVSNGISVVFKKWWRIFELVFYKSSMWFLAPISLYLHYMNMLDENLIGGWYFNMTISQFLVRNVNSFSPTPGGTGTSDYFTKIIYRITLSNKIDQFGFDLENRASIITAIKTFGTIVIPSILSAIALFIVYIGEKRIQFYKQKNKNDLLINNKKIINTKTKSNFNIITTPIFIISILTLILLFIFI